MSLVNNGNTVNYILSNSERVLQKRNALNSVIFNDYDILFVTGWNSSTPSKIGTITITFNTNLNIISNWQVGSNLNLFKKTNNNSISKNFNAGEDNNDNYTGNFGSFNNCLYFDEAQRASVTAITITQSSNGFQGTSVSIRKNFPNLVSYNNDIGQSPNFSFLNNIGNIVVLNLKISISSFSNLPVLASSNIKALILRGYNTTQPDLLKNLPLSLYYLEITQMTSFVVDLAQYFTGTRIAINFSTAQSVAGVTYSGGASFPSAIADTPEYRITSLYNQTNIRLTGNNLSRFIVDFANQVKTVNLGNSVAKKMKFTGASPDTSYEDLNQPLFTTYLTALDFITKSTALGGLGVAISFT